MVKHDSVSSNAEPTVYILCATYNGEAYLQEQLDSIASQSHENWKLLVSDDGSTDASRQIISTFMANRPNVELFDGPNAGGAANFMSLFQRMPDASSTDDWAAFCDQDDVWLPNKLERGLEALSHVPSDKPALYCSRTWVSDVTLNHRQLSARRPRPAGFKNALVQNIAAGNTILLNPAAVKVLRAAARDCGPVVVHDWWVYQMITGVGGVVVHDDSPTLLYRQHGSNSIGANSGFLARFWRIGMILSGEFRKWNDVNIAALMRCGSLLTPQNQATLSQFAEARAARLPLRIRKFGQLGLYRQTKASTAALWVSTLLGKL